MTTETQPQTKEFQVRDQAGTATGDPFAVLAQGDLPARADLQRLGCLRKAALRGARQARADGLRRLSVTLVPDAAAGTLTVKDNGIGMNRDEVIDNLGTIARSGTKKFLEGLERRFRQGCPAHRPVRRGILFGVHRRRPGHGADEARRRRGGAVGLGRRGNLRDPGVGQGGPRHRSHHAPARGGQGVPGAGAPARSWCASTRTT